MARMVDMTGVQQMAYTSYRVRHACALPSFYMSGSVKHDVGEREGWLA